MSVIGISYVTPSSFRTRIAGKSAPFCIFVSHIPFIYVGASCIFCRRYFAVCVSFAHSPPISVAGVGERTIPSGSLRR